MGMKIINSELVAWQGEAGMEGGGGGRAKAGAEAGTEDLIWIVFPEAFVVLRSLP